jgi:hypothetical protein
MMNPSGSGHCTHHFRPPFLGDDLTADWTTRRRAAAAASSSASANE